jgi:cysteine sulfinate desulfinase/cysteine desulfurase-like protein
VLFGVRRRQAIQLLRRFGGYQGGEGGSACSSAIVRPSHVLMAMGLDEERIRSAVRIGIGRFNTAAETEYATRRLIEEVRARQAF